MKPDTLRPLLSVIGLAIGFGFYALANRAPPPWPGLLIGSLFMALGGAAWVYARGERWIQALGTLLLVYGLARMLFLH